MIMTACWMVRTGKVPALIQRVAISPDPATIDAADRDAHHPVAYLEGSHEVARFRGLLRLDGIASHFPVHRGA